MNRITVHIATTGRETLAATLDSLQGQLGPWDEVLVVGDGHCPGAARMFHEAKLPGLYLEIPGGPHEDWGHTPRNRTMQYAGGDYLLFIDDDDVYLPRALDAVRAGILEWPNHVLVFRAEWFQNVPLLWAEPVLQESNVSTQLFCVPNVPGCLGTWGWEYNGDYKFIVETMRRRLLVDPDAQPVFIDKVIVRARPAQAEGRP